MPMQTTIGKTTLRLVTGDIADQDTDAVVTAAHWRLNKGTGTDGTIHTKGGPRHLRGVPAHRRLSDRRRGHHHRRRPQSATRHPRGRPGLARRRRARAGVAGERLPTQFGGRSPARLAQHFVSFHFHGRVRLSAAAGRTRLRSGRLSSSWSESSTTSTRCGWFSTPARTTRHTRYLPKHFSGFCQAELEMTPPNHTLQRTAAGHRGCDSCAPWPPSLSLGRSARRCDPEVRLKMILRSSRSDRGRMET